MKARFLGICLLAGCGGAETSGDSLESLNLSPPSIDLSTLRTTSTIEEPRVTTPTVTTPETPDYQRINGSSGSITLLDGSAITTDNLTGNTVLNDVSGTMVQRSGGFFRIQDSRNLVDFNGFDNNAEATDGTGTLRQLTTGRTYKYMQAYSSSHANGGVLFSSLGVFGNPTRSPDLPRTGSASYTGEAIMSFQDNTTVVPERSSSQGTTLITADFANQRVNVRSNFNTIRTAARAIIADPKFDEIVHEDMVMSGNSYIGGTHQIRKNGVQVDPIGANASVVARGNFFGGEVSGNRTQPAETAGLSVITGDDGAVVNTFFAD